MKLTFIKGNRRITIIGVVRAFLQAHPDQINATDEDGKTLLILAVEANAIGTAKALLNEYRPDLHATTNGKSAIEIADDIDANGEMKKLIETHLKERDAISEKNDETIKKNDETIKDLKASLNQIKLLIQSNKKLVNPEKETLSKQLSNALASAKESTSQPSISDEDCLTEFGQKTLGKFLGYILNLKLENPVSNTKENIFSAEEIEAALDKAKITNEDLESRQFFHSFLLEFHKQRALSSSELEDQEVKEIKNSKEFLSKKAGQKLYQDTKYEKDLAKVTTFGNIEVYHSETIGRRDSQEDAYIIGSAKSDWQDSAKVPALLEKKFADLGPKIRSFGDQINDGSTAIISHYSADQKLIIANLGDSRAVLFVKKPDGSFDWIRLTNDQEPLDILEMARIEGNGGFVVKEDRYKNRVNGILMIARSFGDHYSDLEGLNESRSPNGKKLISYQPDIYQHDIAAILAKNDGSEAFLMTSCDGMYDHGIGNEATYAKALEDWFKNKNEVQEKWGNNVAEYLRDYAISLGSHDNVTVCFSDITQAPTKPLVVGVFDGHGGNVTSSIVAQVLGEDLLEKGAVIQYAGEPKSIEEFVQSLRKKTEIDNNNMDFYPKSNPVTRTKIFPNTKISPTSLSTIANSSEKCNEA